MWQAIAANRRRSRLIIFVMGAVLIALGASLGTLIGPALVDLGYAPPGEETWAGALAGGLAALVAWLTLSLLAVYGGDRLVLRSAHALPIEKRDSPRLWNVVEEMTIASGLGQPPRVYIVEDHAPNAFAVGRSPEKSAVAVTSGLLRLMNRDELQGVIAHEIAHIRNLDIRFMTMAAVLVGSVERLSRGFLRVGPFAAVGRRGGRGRGGGHPALLAVAFVMAIVSPLLVRLLYLACSRQREYLADASAARFTRYPDGLASALEKIAVHHSGYVPGRVSGALAPLYIVNPLQLAAVSNLVSTHPPTENRVKILRGMGGRAGYVDYEAALRKIEGRKARLAALTAAAKSDESIAVRSPSSEPDTRRTAVGRAREVGDLLDRLALFIFVPCVCGMRIKLPPDYRGDSVSCPRCSRQLGVPAALPIPIGGAGGAATPAPAAPPSLPSASSGGSGLQYERTGEGWDAFRCGCGQTIQLGPDFPLDYTICAKCNSRIELKAPRRQPPR